MLKSFLKLSFRNLRKDTSGTLLYFLLLVVGISSFSIIVVIYNNEVQYDQFMRDSDKIYRATTYMKRGDQEIKWAITNGHLATIIEEKIPEVAVATKFQTIQSSQVYRVGERKFEIPERQGFYTDPDFFEVLDYPLLYGDQATALEAPNSMVLSEEYAIRFFNKVDIIGETLEVEYSGGYNLSLKVTGVLKSIPNNSHLQFHILVSGNTSGGWERMDAPGAGFPVHVYFKTLQGIEDDEALDLKLQETANSVYTEAFGASFEINFPIQRFLDIHFGADNLFEAGKPGNLLFTRILFAVGIIILVIAAINFSILYTAKSLTKAKEIGIRKTLGSSHSAIGVRLLAESCLLSLFCTIVAIGVSELLLKSVVRTHLYEADLSMFDAPALIAFVLLAGLVLGVISGSYVTSRSVFFSTTQILKGKLKIERTAFLSGRNLLIIFQFVLTSTLITASLVFMKQLDYVKNKDVGFARQSVISVTRPSNITPQQFEIFKESLHSESAVSAAGFLLYDFLGDYNAGNITVEHEGDTLSARGNSNYISEGLIPAMNLQIVEGRNFSKEIASDSNAVIINEAAKRMLGLNEVVGKKLLYQRDGRPKIIGVVKDYHFQSFMNEIPPLILYNSKNVGYHRNLMIRLTDQNMDEAVARVKEKWDQVGSGVPFEPTYLDSSFLGLVESETKLSKMISTYTVVSIIVACLGLVGLVSYTNEQRKKEMGIRKVYGATEASIMNMVNGYFFKLILLALLVAIPLSVFGIEKWLDTFAYHTQQSPIEYLLAAVLLIGFALIVTSLRTIKTARANPVEVLKEE